MAYQQDIFNVVSSLVGQNNIVPIQVEMVRFVGDYHTAALLTQLIYWQGKQRDPEGWIYKTYYEWEREIALTKYQTSRSAKALEKMGIIETKVARVKLDNGMFGDKAVHYRLKQDEFTEKLIKHLSNLDSKETSLSKVKDINYPKSSNFTSLPIYTETTAKDYNDVQPQQSDPAPQEKETEPSPSFSESEMISILAGLMSLVPEKFQKPAVKNTVEKALKIHSEDYVKLAVLYSIAKSTGNTVAKFKAFLGKCLDNHWHDGWTPDTDETSRLDLESVKAKFRQIPDETLKPLASAGNQYAIEELKRRNL